MDKNGNLKICELSDKTGVSVSTIKYYISLGLIDNAYKTAGNMAYYSPSSVDRIKLIRKLQKERYYPLNVIKRILTLNSVSDQDLALMDTFSLSQNKDRDGSAEPVIPEIPGLSQAQIHSLVDSGVIGCEGFLSETDFKILNIVSRRLEAGMSFEHTLDAFSSYSKNLITPVESDINSMIENSLLRHRLSNMQLVSLIRTNDLTLKEFVSLKIQELGRKKGFGLLNDVSVFSSHYITFIDNILVKVFGNMNITAFLSDPLNLKIATCIEKIRTMSEKSNVSLALDSLNSMIEICSLMQPSDFNNSVFRGIAGCLRLGFYSLCPTFVYDEKLVREAASFCKFDKRVLDYLELGNGELR